MTDKELDDLFQKIVSGHQMPVPPDMWQRVNPQNDKRRRVALLWWSGLGMAALFMLIGTGIWLYHTPSQHGHSASAKQAGMQQKESTLKNMMPPPVQPAETTEKANQHKPVDETSSAQAAQQAKNIINRKATEFYSHKKDGKQGRNFISRQQSSTSGHTGDITVNGRRHTQQLDNKINQKNHENRNPENNNPVITSSESSNITVSSNQLIKSIQKPDSNLTATAANAAKQEPKAAAVKVKKIHGEKTTSFELMVAGYGNSRNVYDVSPMDAVRLFAFGPINQKEKVLMQSFSINARVDKPITKHLSLKTGLQYLQTRQRVSYGYEMVSQSVSVNAVSNDTTVSARLQSSQSIVKGTYNSLNVPVLVSYHTNGTRMSFGATAGVMLNVLSWYGGKVPDESTKQIVAAENTFRTHAGTSLYAGITASRQIGGLQLFAEPHMQYTLSSLTKSSASFRQKITSYGFGIGIRKIIGK